MNQRFTMPMPDDFHLHLRMGTMLRTVLPHTARWFKRAIIMPNTIPSIRTEEDVIRYEREIRFAAGELGFPDFFPLMTIEITEGTMPAAIERALGVGVVAAKVYPRGMTTNSEDGVLDYRAIYPVLGAMEERGMIALFHGESPDPGVFCLDREKAFLATLKDIAATFPRLRIVMEHVTTNDAIDCVLGLPDNVAATITVHHLFLTLDDVIGGKLMPHHFCKPVAKRPEDRNMLLAMAMGGNPKFFLGTDSAPHLQGAKECALGCAGVFTAPVAIPLLVQLFEEHGTLHQLRDFCSGFGPDFYGLHRNEETITLVKERSFVPSIYGGVVPFWGRKEIQWRMESE